MRFVSTEKNYAHRLECILFYIAMTLVLDLVTLLLRAVLVACL